MKFLLLVTFSLLLCSSILLLGSAQQCGRQAGGSECPEGRCCSRFGWCGDTHEYCGDGCQSLCRAVDVSDIVPAQTYYLIAPHFDSPKCPEGRFYSYDAFVEAARNFSGFGTTGDIEYRKREMAAFFAQTSHATAYQYYRNQRDPYSWGYCNVLDPMERYGDFNFCIEEEGRKNYTCVPGKRYFGRGPMQLTWSVDYGDCGEALGVDLLSDPDLLGNDPVFSFESAMWFWMTPQSPEAPSCHDVMVGEWKPSRHDIANGRQPGYGATTNIIDGRFECGFGWTPSGKDRIEFYKRICKILGVDPGNHLDCYNQEPFSAKLNNRVQRM